MGNRVARWCLFFWRGGWSVVDLWMGFRSLVPTAACKGRRAKWPILSPFHPFHLAMEQSHFWTHRPTPLLNGGREATAEWCSHFCFAATHLTYCVYPHAYYCEINTRKAKPDVCNFYALEKEQPRLPCCVPVPFLREKRGRKIKIGFPLLRSDWVTQAVTQKLPKKGWKRKDDPPAISISIPFPNNFLRELRTLAKKKKGCEPRGCFCGVGPYTTKV